MSLISWIQIITGIILFVATADIFNVFVFIFITIEPVNLYYLRKDFNLYSMKEKIIISQRFFLLIWYI